MTVNNLAGALAICLLSVNLAGQVANDDSGPADIEKVLLAHIKKVDAARLEIRDFPEGKQWFNSPPLRLKKELSGKIVILDFWTYCCINCIHVLPDLAALENKYAGQPVAFVGVHSAKFDNEKVSGNIRQAVLRYEIAHPVINDDEMIMWRAARVRSWPSIVVVGPRGNLLLMVSGEGNREILDACIAAALKFYPAESFRHEPVPMALEREKSAGDSPLAFPGKLAIDPTAKRLFISDSNHNRIVVTDLDGTCIETIGTGRVGLVDGGHGEARFNLPQGVAWHEGALYVADAENHALRRVDLRNKTVTTLAGTGRQGRDYRGGKKGTEQEISTPWDVAIRDGRVLIAMAGTHQIWSYSIETTICDAYSGSGRELNLNAARPLEAAWAQPSGLTIGNDKLFVADSESSSIRAIDLVTGSTRTVVGGDDSNPQNLFAFGDVDGEGDTARLQHALGVLWIESLRRVVVADTYNHRLKLVDPANNTVEAWAGSGTAGLADGIGLEARFSEPSGLALAPDDKRVYVADTNNHAIRVVDIATTKVTTLELTGVPAALSRFAPRSLRLADIPDTPTVRAGTLKLAPGTKSTIIVRLRLPDGHHYTRGAGSRWQVLAEKDPPVLIQEKHASGALTGDEPIRIPVTATAEKTATPETIRTIRLEALAYHCKGEESCRIDAVVFEIPVEVGVGDATALELTHTFGAK